MMSFKKQSTFHKFQPVPFTQVCITDGFWAPRRVANRSSSVPGIYEHLKKDGRVDAFKLDWKPGMPELHVFWDSDVAKWVEAASYELSLQPDPKLEQLLDEVTSLIVSAQQSDGYLNTYFTVVEPDKRWTNLRQWHELYGAGHLLEAAIAHYQATCKRTFLDAMIQYMDYIASVFGTEPGKKRGYCGHQEIELALMRLYKLTGEERFFRLAQYFLEERGQKPNYLDEEFEDLKVRGVKVWDDFSLDYFQADVPVREMKDAYGHSVRAMYYYSAVADLATETGDSELLNVLERLWESVTLRRMYLTGGIGAAGQIEGFGIDYSLPNDTAYAETCAAIGLVFFAHRMLQISCDSRYSDVMERVLYNGFISSVSLDGTKFFYENRLASRGTHHRQEWFGCACCLANVARLLPTLGEYIYATNDSELAVHLYMQSEAKLSIGTNDVIIRQETEYPWQGTVRLNLSPEKPTEFTLRLRVPGWCREWSLAVNGENICPEIEKGYACLTHTWKTGDVVSLDMGMPVDKIEAHPNVYQDVNRLALQRGPIVYCLEDVDHEVSVRHIAISPEAEFTPHFQPDLLGGVVVLEGEGTSPGMERWKKALYQPYSRTTRPVKLRAVPYCVWDNRAPGGMMVWLAKA